MPATTAEKVVPNAELSSGPMTDGCGQVVDHAIARDRQLDLDRDHALLACGIAVDEVLRFPRTVGQCREAVTQRTFD